MDEAAFTRQRHRMVAEQIEERGVCDPRVLEALRRVPRHLFVPHEHRYIAYADGPLPIGLHQTISQPYIVALMTELLQLQGDETILEVGTGSGYQAAVLSCLAAQVHTIERHAELAERARLVLRELGYANVNVHVGDGSPGLPEFAPFLGIMVTASAPKAPKPLLDQLAEGGRLVLPTGGFGGQVLTVWQRTKDDWTRRSVLPVAFVPLIGEYGWEK
jgi:protein-L-isoaspartate(D-aspartate) O-methyltransferase